MAGVHRRRQVSSLGHECQAAAKASRFSDCGTPNGHTRGDTREVSRKRRSSQPVTEVRVRNARGSSISPRCSSKGCSRLRSRLATHESVSGTCSTLSLGSRARSQQSRLPGDRVHHQAVQLDLLPQPQPLADLCDQGFGHGESLRPMTRVWMPRTPFGLSPEARSRPLLG